MSEKKERKKCDLNDEKRKLYVNQLFLKNKKSIDDRLKSLADRERTELVVCPGLDLTRPLGIEELKIGEKTFNESCNDISKMKMDLSEFKKLKRIEIGNGCFKHVREFVIDGLESLEIMKIGGKCFRPKALDDMSDEDIRSFIPTNGVCRITNCPNLRQLEIGDSSFEDFKSFELSNLNSIQSIKFGGGCFKYADFSLKGE